MGWLTGYKYRRKIPIENYSESLTNYQKLIILHSGNGTSTAGELYLNNLCYYFPSDIRFTQSDGETLIDYWFENPTGSVVRTWVELPSVDDSNNTDYYIYYGKDDTSTLSNGKNTFVFFDHFSGSGYDTNTYYSGSGVPPIKGTFTTSDSVLKIESTGDTGGGEGIYLELSSNQAINLDKSLIYTRLLSNYDTNTWATIRFHIDSVSDGDYLEIKYRGQDNDHLRTAYRLSGSIGGSDNDITSATWVNDKWRSFIIRKDSTIPSSNFQVLDEDFSQYGNSVGISLPYSSNGMHPFVFRWQERVYNAGRYMKVDYIFVANYRFDEPNWLSPGIEESKANWLAGYNYRKKIPISSRSEGSLSDYQKYIAVYSGAGTDSPGEIYLNNKSLNWPYDIRFTEGDGETPVTHWLQFSSNVTNKAIFWLKIPTVDSSTSQDYYIYYGNAGANSASDINNTWETAEDWSTDISNLYNPIIDEVGTSYNRAYYRTGSTDGDNFTIKPPYRILHFFLVSKMTGTDPDWGAWIHWGTCEISGNSAENSFPSGGQIRLGITRNDDTYGTNASHFYWNLYVRSGTTSNGAVYGGQIHYVSVDNQWFTSEIQYHNTFVSGILYSGTNFTDLSPSSVSTTDTSKISRSGNRHHYWNMASADNRTPYYYWSYDANRRGGVKIAGVARGSLLHIPAIWKYVTVGKLEIPEPEWSTPGSEEESSPISITSASGCVASGTNSATISAKVNKGSGYAWFYWSRNADAGPSKSGWLASSNKGWQVSGTYLTHEVTSMSEGVPYYYRAYITSGLYEDWSQAKEFLKKTVVLETSTYNGCVASSTTTARITGKVLQGSGTVWFLWGDEDRGAIRHLWNEQAKIGTKYAGDDFYYDIYWNLKPFTTYYYRVYISSNWAAKSYTSYYTTFQLASPQPVEISNVSGCVASGSFTATLSAKITNGSGNVRFYYESGSAGGGTDPFAWDSYVDYPSIVHSGEYITREITGLSPGWTYSFRGYISSNGWLGGEDWFDATDTFKTFSALIYKEGNSLRIYYSCNAYPHYYIDCWCKRFDVSNYDVTIETFLSPGARNQLFQSVTPGAVRELYNILGKPKYIDTTYSSGNTLRLEPIGNLTNLENEMIIAVKSISDSPIAGSSKKFNIKIEGKRLDI